MITRGIRVGVVCCVASGLFLIGWSAVRSQRPAPKPTGLSPIGVLQSGQKPKAPVREMIPSNAMPDLTVADVNSSMKARRDHAWSTVKRVWEPVQIQGGQIPTWMTWYEQEDIQVLYRVSFKREDQAETIIGSGSDLGGSQASALTASV